MWASLCVLETNHSCKLNCECSDQPNLLSDLCQFGVYNEETVGCGVRVRCGVENADGPLSRAPVPPPLPQEGRGCTAGRHRLTTSKHRGTYRERVLTDQTA